MIGSSTEPQQEDYYNSGDEDPDSTEDDDEQGEDNISNSMMIIRPSLIPLTLREMLKRQKPFKKEGKFNRSIRFI